MDRDEEKHQQDLLKIFKNNLRQLEIQSASHGIVVPLVIQNSIDNIRKSISDIEESIEKSEVTIQNQFEDAGDVAAVDIEKHNLSTDKKKDLLYGLNIISGKHSIVNIDDIEFIKQKIKRNPGLFTRDFLLYRVYKSIQMNDSFLFKSKNYSYFVDCLDVNSLIKGKIIDVLANICFHLYDEVQLAEEDLSKIISRSEIIINVETRNEIKREIINMMIGLNLIQDVYDEENQMMEYKIIKNDLFNFLYIHNGNEKSEDFHVDIFMNVLFLEYKFSKIKYDVCIFMNYLLESSLENVYIVNTFISRFFIKNKTFIKNLKSLRGKLINVYLLGNSVHITNNLRLLYAHTFFERTKESYILAISELFSILPLSYVDNSEFEVQAYDAYVEYWCSIINGTWYLPNGNQEELEEKQLTYLYDVARYPITNADFSCFIATNGYDLNQPWWTPEAKEWFEIQRSKSKQPQTVAPFSLWNYPRYWFHHAYCNPIQPVVGISWYEAQAYCAWLTAKGHDGGWLDEGEIIRLPTHDEWQRVATHTDGRETPWGSTYSERYPAHLNLKSVDEQDYVPYLCAIGCFPAGKAASGAEDLIGNVWEWTKTHEDTQDGKYYLVVGGSFRDDEAAVQNDFSRRVPGTEIADNIGFRVIRVAKDVQ